MNTGVLSKIRSILETAGSEAPTDSVTLARRIYAEALVLGEASPFRLPGSKGGNSATVSSLITIRKHVEFCETLRLVAFCGADELFEYTPVVPPGTDMNPVIAKHVWDFLEREGVTKRVVRAAMMRVRVNDLNSIWGQFDVRNISRDTFRKCFYLLGQVSPEVSINRKWTYDLTDELVTT